jgi:hypothetical protein
MARDYLEEAFERIEAEARSYFEIFDKELLRKNMPEWMDILNSWGWPKELDPQKREQLAGKSPKFYKEFGYFFYAAYCDFIRTLPLSERRRLADHWANKNGYKTGEEMIEHMIDTYYRPHPNLNDPHYLAKQRDEMIRSHFYSNDPKELRTTVL